MDWERIAEIEDHLQSHHVFLNGISKQPCHSDSYLTTVSFDALDRAWEAGGFSSQDWSQAIEYWLTNENMQPPLRLVALTLKRKMA